MKTSEILMRAREERPWWWAASPRSEASWWYLDIASDVVPPTGDMRDVVFDVATSMALSDEAGE